MNLIIITGFLGSGKTTLLLEITRELSSQGKKIAIIENEVGQVGIDDCLIRENDFNVREIYSGCICCSLRIDLVSTLLSLEREYEPDIVILEPSGVAGPKQVLSALQGYGGEIDKKTVVNIVDVSRYQHLESLDLPIITDGIETAGIVVLNKTDLVAEQEVTNLEKRLNTFENQAVMIPVSLLKDKRIDSLIKEICSDGKEDKSDKTELSPAPKMPEPTVYSREEKIVFDTKDSVETLTDKWIDLLKHSAQKMKDVGAVIGHIKVMLNAGKNGYIVISVTSPEHPPEIKGRLKDTADEIRLRINAIAYNIDKETLSEIFVNC